MPELLAVVESTKMLSTYKRTLLFASAVPLNVGVVVLTMLISAGLLTTGALGARESTVKVLILEYPEVFPAASVAVTFTAWLPCVKVGLTFVQFPDPSAVVESTNTLST